MEGNYPLVGLQKHSFRFKCQNMWGANISSFSCIFWGKLIKQYVGAPSGVGASSGKSWIRHCRLFIFTYCTQMFVVVMWAVAIAVNLALLYGLYPYNKETTFIEPVWLNDLHAVTHRTVWALIVAWITYACLTGWGGILPLISKTRESLHFVLPDWLV